MTPQELRNSILQLAVQGKLVEQCPEEGTGEELYQAIQKEKQALFKDGIIKKAKVLPEVTDDEALYAIPDNWKWVRLGSAACIEMGQSPDGSSVSEVATGIEFHQGKVYFGKQFLEESPLKTSAPTKIAEPNSVLLCVRAPVGKVNITSRKICVGRGLCAVSPIANMDARFVFYLLSTFENIFVKQATGTTFIAVTGKIVDNQPIPLPPLGEQKRIVQKIEEIMPLVDQYEEAWNRLEKLNKCFPTDLQKSILQYAIQGKLVEQRPEEGTGEELFQQIQKDKEKLVKKGRIKNNKVPAAVSLDNVPFELPGNWLWVKWGDVINVVSARRVHQSDWKPRGIPFYRAREIAKLADKGHVDNELFISQELFDQFSKTGVPKPGDLMVTAVGTLGKTYVVKPEDVFYYKDASVICLENYSHLYSDYLKYVMQSDLMMKQIRGNSDGTTVATLTMVRMIEYILPLPPLAEQRRIVSMIEELLPFCEEMESLNI